MGTPEFRPRIQMIAATIVLAAAVLPAQQPGGTRTGTTGGNTPSPSAGTSGIGTRPNTTTGTSIPGTSFPSETQGPIFLSGKVMLNDGTAPSDPVMIERVCNGTPHPQGYTDSKGRFSFQLGQDNRSVFPDASYEPDRGLGGGGFSNPNGGIRASALFDCEIRAALPGYRSDVISLATRRSMDNPDLGTIILHRIANVEGLTTSATSALAPKEARRNYEKGLQDASKGKPDEAQKDYQKAVDLYPKYAAAWYSLGLLYEQRDHVDEARKAYAQALAADSRYINPSERLYMLDAKESKWQDVADNTERVLRLNPYDFASAYYFNAIANLELKHLDAAEKSAREAVKLDTAHTNPRTSYILGMILAQKQDFAAAAGYLREYLKAVPDGKDSEAVRKQLGSIEEFARAKAEPKTEP